MLFYGHRPLAVTAKRRAATVPADVRLACQTRDQGCRFPGSTDPLAHADLHHTVRRARGGDDPTVPF